VLPVYYLLPVKFRNYFLILISAYFYMYVKVEYIAIILLIIISNYLIGIKIEESPSRSGKKQLLNLSLFINLGILIFFKYWNFLISNVDEVFRLMNTKHQIPFLDIALPLGLSYYIFQTIGYTLDIYRGSQKAERNFFHFTLFTLFFPKLLVGPIERAGRLFPQISKAITFDTENLIEGGRRIAWGLFKKLVVADRILIYQNAVFGFPKQEGCWTVLFASLIYTFQVYADFSGYTDIAIGTARLFGYNLMENFKMPFLAKNLSDFWRRWHISLSSWVNDYIYNPMAFNRRDWGTWGVIYALFISFIVIGIWHGATWNYVLFGALQSLALIYEILTRKARKKISKKIPPVIYNNLSRIFTFLYMSFCLIIFRTQTFGDALYILRDIFVPKSHVFFFDNFSTLFYMLTGCAVILLYDIQEEFKIFKISLFSNRNWVIQQMSFAVLIIYILLAGVFDGGQFIYFAF
ncbi:MAG: MBOAT family protein, partial [Bacteroidota bacterium]|nr:MBOAT family protein [Bacteroidota bacterium]